MVGGPEAFPEPIEGQLIVPGYAPTFGKQTNEEIIREEVDKGNLDEEVAKADIAMLGELAIRARLTVHGSS